MTTISRLAANIRDSNISGMAEKRIVGPVPITCAGAPPAHGQRQWFAQEFVKVLIHVRHPVARRTRTGSGARWGLRSASSASTQGAYFAFTRNSGSAQFWLPQ